MTDNESPDVFERMRQQVQSCRAFLSIVSPGEPDAAWASQLGLAIEMDKPIYFLVDKGARVSNNMKRVAAHIEHFDSEDAASRDRAITAITTRIKNMDLV